MTFDTTYKNLKKRIFDILDEYSADTDTVFVADADKELISSRIPDAVNSSLVRMYESLPIGKEKVVQRVNIFSPIAYDRGIPDGDRTTLEFTTPTPNMAVFFRFFGSGRITFCDKSGKAVGTIDCGGTATLSSKRVYLSFASAGLYRVSVSGTVRIIDFSVYANDGKTSVNAICSVFEASFELPRKFGKILSAVGDYGEIDKERIHIENGYAFLPTRETGTGGCLYLEYKKTPDIISGSTADSFSFELSPLAFEALVCLTASEVCREQDASKHTRLVYKYNDLCEGLKEEFEGENKRNTFFKVRRRMRW